MADNSNKVEIKVNADAGNAVSALGRVFQSLSGVGRAVGAVMKTLGRLNWAIMAVQTIVSWVQKLREWSNRAATAARELAERLRDESIATAAAHAAEAYKKLNKEIAEANRLEKERNSILDRRKSAQRDIEDANLEFAKAREIAALDPSQEGYADAKAAIERKYERQAAETRFSREQEDAAQESRRLYAEADRKEREADAMQKVADRQWKVEQRKLDVSRKDEFAAKRTGTAEDREKAEKSHKAWEAAYDAAKATQDAVDALRRDAASLRRQGGEIMGSPGAKARRDAALERADIAEREAAAKKSKEDSEAQAKADRAIRREKEIAALDVNSKSYDDDKAAIERKYKRMELEAKRTAAAGPEIAAVDAEIAALENEEREAAARRAAKEAAEEAKTDVEKRQDLASDLESVARNAASADLVSMNRLTAMGLGSGVSGGSGVASDVKSIVDLLKEEIKAVKDNKPRDTPSVAYYTE